MHPAGKGSWPDKAKPGCNASPSQPKYTMGSLGMQMSLTVSDGTAILWCGIHNDLGIVHLASAYFLLLHQPEGLH